MRIFIIILIIVSVLIAIWIIGSYLSVKNLEEPSYEVIEKRSGYEIRQYDPYIVAEVEVEGDQSQALNSGFRYLAGYIFGWNTKGDSIKMTAPVSETQISEKIAMTVPVADTPSSWGKRIVQFSMPSKYTLDTLPKPNNEQVKLKEIPGKRLAVLSYTGYATQSRVEKKKEELKTLLSKESIEIIWEMTSAQYNPPLSFPLTRRNEILAEVK